MNRQCRTLLAVALTGLVAGYCVISPVRADELYEYGEYLSSECTTCHQLGGKTKGIPKITGMPVKLFIVVLRSYRDGSQENEAMKSVAKRLTNEDMRALAVFFNKQGK